MSAVSGAASPPLLEVRDLEKTFPGVRALYDVSFSVARGEVHALLGENGAGKSTLIKIVSGVFPPNRGRILIDGVERKFNLPEDARRAGVATIYQELLLFPELTVAENIFMGHAPRGLGGRLDWRAMRERAEVLLASLEIHDLAPDRIVGSLSVGNRQRVEILRALSHDARLLIMDEPTAALTEPDVVRLFKIVRLLKARGVGIIYISHKIDELKQISDRVTVLRDGEYVGTVPTATTSIDTIISMMVGRKLSDAPIHAAEPLSNDIALAVTNLNCGPLVRDVAFSLRRGEILGFAGLMGAGRTEVARAVFGADRAQSGEVVVLGKKVSIRTPAQAVAAGIGYLSEDRKRFGLAVGMDVASNVVMANLPEYLSFRFFLKKGEILEAVKKFVKLLDIRTPSETQEVRLLSGGNQQKIVVAKWLARDCDILFFDEPTRGIDVGAKAEIYKLLRGLADQGKAIVMISSELPEILRMSDRIIVMCEGRITGELPAAEATQERIMQLATQRESMAA